MTDSSYEEAQLIEYVEPLLEDYELYANENWFNIEFQSNGLKAWIDLMDILDRDPEKYFREDALEEVNANGSKYWEIGAAYKESGDTYRVSPEIFPFEGELEEELQEAIERVKSWNRNDADLFMSDEERTFDG